MSKKIKRDMAKTRTSIKRMRGKESKRDREREIERKVKRGRDRGRKKE